MQNFLVDIGGRYNSTTVYVVARNHRDAKREAQYQYPGCTVYGVAATN